MAVDLFSAVLGFLVGGAGVAVLFEVRSRSQGGIATAKLTTAWDLGELPRGVLVARDVQDVPVPEAMRVLASGRVDPGLQSRSTLQRVDGVHAEFAVDAAAGKAILFLGGVRRDTLALVSVDEDVIARLVGEARRLEERGGDYLERHAVGQLAGKIGVRVETQGTVAGVVPFGDRFLIRLDDHGDAIGVVVDKDPAELRDERILVRGRVGRDAKGYQVIEAEDIRRIR